MSNKTILAQPFRYLVLLMFVAIPPAQATDQWNTLVDAMQSRLAAAEKNSEFSGAILIGVGDEIIYSQAFGLAHKGLNVPNKVDTKINLGSLDKQFTMVAVMRLVDEGKIDLDANVASYLPDWPNADVAENVTIRQLLTHTSGMGFYWSEQLFTEIGRFRTLQDFAALFINDELAFRPGEQWAYSNNGYIVLGLILEAVTGEDYHDHIRRVLFSPLGMSNSGPFAVDEVTENRATGYTRMTVQDAIDGPDAEGEVQQEKWYANYYTHPPRGASAGGGYSTVQDLFEFTRALHTGRLLTEKSYQTITQPYNQDLLPDNARSFYGYGMQIWKPGQPDARLGHSGGGAGNGAFALYYPKLDLSVIWLTNQEGSARIPALLLREYFAENGPNEPDI